MQSLCRFLLVLSMLPLAMTARPLTAQKHPSAGTPRFGRIWDQRVGPMYYLEGGRTRYTDRQRLERKNPNGPSSDVVQPIGYVIDSTVPRQWIPWIRRGLDEWTVAFEKIGFRHAIDVREATAGDTTVTMPGCLVTWDPVPQDGALTTLQADAIGDITNCRIALNDGIIPMMSRYAFLYLGATHPAMRYPFADSVQGRFLARVVAHEAGHSLGFFENFPAGTFYPTDSLHSATFVHRFGFTPSVMGYTHFDFVARGNDRIALDDLIARVGPMDVWALGWAYRPVPSAKTPEDELPTLERWRAVQDTAFGWHQTTSLPGKGGEDGYLLGSDLVASAASISHNLSLTVPQIDSQAARAEPSNPAAAAELAGQLRGAVLNVWPVVITSPAALIGGAFPRHPVLRSPTEPPMQLMDSAAQARALAFTVAHIMYGQDPLVETLFGRTARDSSLMLFGNAIPSWSMDEWQQLQQMMMPFVWRKGARLKEQAASNISNVLPLWCREARRVRSDVRRVAKSGTATPEEQRQAQAIANQLDSMEGQPGFVDAVCR